MVLPIRQKPQTIVRRQATNKFGSTSVCFEDVQGPGQVQAPPYDRPLPYFRSTRRLVVLANEDNYHTQVLRTCNSTQRDTLYSRAYSKFLEEVLQGSRMEMGMNLASAGLTVQLLKNTIKGVTRMEYLGNLADKHNRFVQVLRNAATSPRRGRARWRRKAAGILGVAPTSQRQVDQVLRRHGLRAGSRHFASEYLAFHYGWSPLIGDLFLGLQQLQDGYTESPIPVLGRARCPISIVQRLNSDWLVTTTGSESFELGAVAQVSEPVLFVLNRTGLINPATVVWDKIPFSFVTDWFANFSQVFAAPTDFVGVTLTNCYGTHYQDFQVLDSLKQVRTVPGRLMRTEGIYMKRELYSRPPIPSFVAKVPFGSSWRRSFAQISLLAVLGISPRVTKTL